jgi:hypothetical protein
MVSCTNKKKVLSEMSRNALDEVDIATHVRFVTTDPSSKLSRRTRYPFRENEVVFLVTTGGVVLLGILLAVLMVTLDNTNRVTTGGGVANVPNAPHPPSPTIVGTKKFTHQ